MVSLVADTDQMKFLDLREQRCHLLGLVGVGFKPYPTIQEDGTSINLAEIEEPKFGAEQQESEDVG